jgi:hypothetical protein
MSDDRWRIRREELDRENNDRMAEERYENRKKREESYREEQATIKHCCLDCSMGGRCPRAKTYKNGISCRHKRGGYKCMEDIRSKQCTPECKSFEPKSKDNK